MHRRLHRKKRRKTSIKFGLLFLLALILVGNGIYVEHVRTEQTASEKKAANAPETLPKTSTTFTNQQSIEPKNTLSASIEQSLVEKDFSGTVLVFHHGQVILNKAYGWKNQSKRIRNTINTQYCIGSIQKGQTAYLIMQAIKAGKITMDEKLSTFFPEIPNSDNISIKDMLNMSSGLRIDEKKINALNTTDTKEILNATVQQTTVDPTASYSYQPVNYVLLAGVLEKVYQSDYDHLFEKLLKEPMGLGETSFYSASNTAQALSYSQNVGNPIYEPTTASSYADELGTGNVFMTSSDLYHYFRNLFDPHFLTTEERTDLLYTYPGEKYASGLYDTNTYYHARGVKARFEAVANFSKDGQNGIILLSNVWNQPKGCNDFASQLYKRIAASA